MKRARGGVNAGPVRVVTFYRFVPLPDLEAFADRLAGQCGQAGLLGTVILAGEGINATLAGEPEAVDAWLSWLAQDPRFADLPVRASQAEENPFYRLKVKIRPEIVTLGRPDVPVAARTGVRVAPEEWDRLLRDPEVIVIDTRNSYEVAAGSFSGAIDPGTGSFREFPAFVEDKLDPGSHRKVAMFCTGGIRCEKASAWMLEQGFEQVYQLAGGILAYLESVPEGQGSWEGDCFVFDHRVSVGYGLARGGLQICYGCRQPLKQEDLGAPGYEEGVSCLHCHHALTDRRRAALRERHRQELMARERGTRHLGNRQ